MSPQTPAPSRRSGFTLIELLAVMMIIGILATFLVPEIPRMMDRAKVTACTKNLQEIYKGLLNYEIKYDRIPPDGGARFCTCLIYADVFENTKANAKRLSCPAVSSSALDISGLPAEEWYSDKESITGASTAYAGRDMKRHPLRKMIDGKEPLVACDNDPQMNHATTTNVLYGDGNVTALELFLLKEEGKISQDTDLLIVGPDSDIEDLRKLSLD